MSLWFSVKEVAIALERSIMGFEDSGIQSFEGDFREEKTGLI